MVDDIQSGDSGARKGTPQFNDYRATIVEPVGVDPPKNSPYWRDRQTQLVKFGFVDSGEVLWPDEIRFAERMLSRGESIRWRSTQVFDQFRQQVPVNDISWLSRGGRLVEVKSPTSPTYAAAERLMWAAITRANRRFATQVALGEPVTAEVKDTFILDFGLTTPNTFLNEELAQFNCRHDDVLLAELWVMFNSGGTLDQIELKEMPGGDPPTIVRRSRQD